MISRRPLYSVLIGVTLAAGALFAIYYFRGTPTPSFTEQSMETQKVLVATRDIPFGTKLSAELVEEAAWPKGSVPADAIMSRDELTASPQGQRIAIRSLVAGEPLLRSKISDFGEKPKLSRRVPLAMRAYSVRVSDVSGISGFLLPGDRIDVLLTRTDAKGQLAAEVILQDLTVLGIDQMSDEDADQPVVAKTATIQVTPEQTQVLALAEQVGTLSLALRNYADGDKPALGKLVLDNSPAAAVAMPAASPHGLGVHRRREVRPRNSEVIVRRGTAVSVEVVSDQ